MNCSEFEQLLEGYLDRELSGTLRLEFDTHRLRCRLCQQKLALMESCATVLERDRDTPALSDGFSDRVLAAIALARPEPRVRRLSPMLRVPLQAAAAVLFAVILIQQWPRGSAPAPIADPGAKLTLRASNLLSPGVEVPGVEAGVLGDVSALRQLFVGSAVSDDVADLLASDPLTRVLHALLPNASPPAEESAVSEDTHYSL